MAKCVVSRVEGLPMPMCTVHTKPAPCLHNGEPASPEALHTTDGEGRDRLIHRWWLKTRGQRGLVLHRHSWPGLVDGEHPLTVDCPCGPEVIDASDEPIPRPEPSTQTPA
ncbi:hypothetical protein [Saccharothrix hoggarensis]|uniref:Uncharacterized protein n=1 Tax=Saccharothrix hoggarensis TaxID=913853 RepID=A0ABW3QDQ4_9PSEU